MLERGSVENDIRFEVCDQANDTRTIANIGDTAGNVRLAVPADETLHNRVQRRLGILDHKQTRGAEGDDAFADFRADGATATGDHDRFAGDKLLEPKIIDFYARPQQQVFDRDRCQLHGGAAGVQPNFTRAVQVYDSLGRAHDVTMAFLRNGAANSWSVEIYAQAGEVDAATHPDGLIASGTVSFNGDGSLGTVAVTPVPSSRRASSKVNSTLASLDWL